MEIRAASVAELAPVWHLIEADDLNPQVDGEWFAAYEAGEITGASHLVDVEGDELLDDLWVHPAHRRQGIGRALVTRMQELRTALWLIADPEGVAYYERSGFVVAPSLPPPIAARYERLGLWPGHLDHLHVPMRWTGRGARGRHKPFG